MFVKKKHLKGKKVLKQATIDYVRLSEGQTPRKCCKDMHNFYTEFSCKQFLSISSNVVSPQVFLFGKKRFCFLSLFSYLAQQQDLLLLLTSCLAPVCSPQHKSAERERAKEKKGGGGGRIWFDAFSMCPHRKVKEREEESGQGSDESIH